MTTTTAPTPRQVQDAALALGPVKVEQVIGGELSDASPADLWVLVVLASAVEA
jgi:hypothetical protein